MAPFYHAGSCIGAPRSPGSPGPAAVAPSADWATTTTTRLFALLSAVGFRAPASQFAFHLCWGWSQRSLLGHWVTGERIPNPNPQSPVPSPAAVATPLALRCIASIALCVHPSPPLSSILPFRIHKLDLFRSLPQTKRPGAAVVVRTKVLRGCAPSIGERLISFPFCSSLPPSGTLGGSSTRSLTSVRILVRRTPTFFRPIAPGHTAPSASHSRHPSAPIMHSSLPSFTPVHAH